MRRAEINLGVNAGSAGSATFILPATILIADMKQADRVKLGHCQIVFDDQMIRAGCAPFGRT